MLAGAYNFRDLGGLRTRDGRTLRAGRLFRSDTLQALTAADAVHLYQVLGLRGIVDLRLAREVADEGRGPLAERADIRYANVPLQMAATEGVAPHEVMRHLYLGCLGPDAPLAAAVQQLSEFADGPVVFHCAAGKDRTGVLAALVLRLLDVHEDDIVADYMRSASAMPRMIERFATWPRYREHMALTPPQAYAVEEAPLRAFLQALNSAPRGARGWAEDRGISTETLQQLRQQWLA